MKSGGVAMQLNVKLFFVVENKYPNIYDFNHVLCQTVG
jgi:hypothetical protein